MIPRFREVEVDEAITAHGGGVASFVEFCRERGIDGGIAQAVAWRKTEPGLAYPLDRVRSALVPLAALGMGCTIGVERLAPYPTIEHPFGDGVPSIDTHYRDLRRVDAAALDALEGIANRLALQVLSRRYDAAAIAAGSVVELDVETSVLERYGTQ